MPATPRFQRILLALCAHLTATATFAQPWTPLSELPEQWADAPVRVEPLRRSLYHLDLPSLQTILSACPPEDLPGTIPVRVDLPVGAGRFERFELRSSPILEPALAAQWTDVRTYAGTGVDDTSATIRISLTAIGFQAQILRASGTVRIDPYWKDQQQYYVVYDRREAAQPLPPCSSPEPAIIAATGALADDLYGADRRTYRLACAATGEFTNHHGGLANAIAEIAATVNRVTQIYERDLNVRLVLVAGNNALVYTDPATDPFRTLNAYADLIGLQEIDLPPVLNSVIGSANYDLGHVFSVSPFGGRAFFGVCNNTSSTKAKAISTAFNPSSSSDGWVLLVAHEIGHQFGASHSFNGLASNCAGNRSAPNAYEPGSGSTIMAYPGICGSDNLQSTPDDYFHINSLQAMKAFIASTATCAALTTAVNVPPRVVPAMPAGLTLPRNTPFTLRAAGFDQNDHALSYSFEQFDLSPAAQALPVSDPGVGPILRSRPPATSPMRQFPRAYSSSFALPIGEVLPDTNRTLNFRITARDQQGGTAIAPYQIPVTTAAGPFTVTSPAGATLWAPGSSQTVTWNVAGTNNPPVNVSHVNILMSLDGGLSFPITLAANTPNDGSQTITVPNIGYLLNAVVKVEAVDHIFHAVSNAQITVNTTPTNRYATEFFENAGQPLDLSNRSITLTPVGTTAYDVCIEPITALPVDPAGAANFGAGTNSLHSLSLFGVNIILYGQTASTFYISPRGYINLGDFHFLTTPTLANHFSVRPRISALFADLAISSGGSMLYQFDGLESVTITWLNVRNAANTSTNTFQATLFYNTSATPGVIRLSYLNVTAPASIVGLSPGPGNYPDSSPADGIPDDYVETDLSTLACVRNAPPALTGASSRRIHAAEGPADVQMLNPAFTYHPITQPAGSLAVEPRVGPLLAIELRYNQPMVALDGVLSANDFVIRDELLNTDVTASLFAGVSGAGSDTFILRLADTSRRRILSIRSSGVVSAANNTALPAGADTVYLCLLAADLNADRRVDGADLATILSGLAGSPLSFAAGVSTSAVRRDLDLNATSNALADVAEVLHSYGLAAP